MWVQSLSWEDPLEEVMATQASILAGKTTHTWHDAWVARMSVLREQNSVI